MEHKNDPGNAWQRYFPAIALVAVATALRLWPLDMFGTRLTWLTFYPAVAIAAFYGGLYAGLFGAVLSCLSAYFLLPFLMDRPFIRDFVDWLGMAIFFLTCAVISIVAELMHRANARVKEKNLQIDAARRGLEDEVARRLEAEEVLRHSWRHLEMALDTAKVAVVSVDSDMRVVFFDSRAESMFGYTAQEVMGRPLDMLLPPPPDDGARTHHALGFAAASDAARAECEAMRKDGAKFQAEVSLARSELKGRGAYTAVLRDVTERIRTEDEMKRLNALLAQRVEERNAELAESEERYRMLVDGVKDYAIYMLDTEGRIMSWNAGARRLKGYEAEEIIGRHFSCFFTPEDAEQGKPERALAVAARDGMYEEEGWRVRKDGSRFVVDAVITAMHDRTGRHVGFSKITRDITERKRAEAERARLVDGLRQALAESNHNRAQFEAVFQSMQDGLVVFDMQGNVVLVNEAEARINGFSNANEMRRNMAFFAQVYELFQPDGQLVPVNEWPVSRILRGETLCNVELRGRRSDTGQEWFFSFSGAPIRDENGVQYLAATLTRDITEQKKAEEDIRRMNEVLEHRVAERTARLEDVNKELEAFSYSVSHDLRAPLRGIDGFSQVLLEDYSDKLDAQGQDSLRRVRAATQRMAQLIDDMLNLSRMTRMEMRLDNVDMSSLAESICSELKKTRPDRDVTFSIEPGLEVNGDARLLRVMIENLLGNAWKFTSRHESAKIEFGAIRKEGQTVYYVRDDGAGFDMTYADRLFGPFQRLHGMNEFEGTGIGLATVQRIIRRHNGRIWAEGAVERGAAFYFTL